MDSHGGFCKVPLCFLLQILEAAALMIFNIYEFQVGLLYDEDSLQSVLDMTFDWTKEEREMLRNKVPPLLRATYLNFI